jgi:endonuclease-3 related protein
MMVGAILTQNTAWANVKKALTNLQNNGLEGPRVIHKMSYSELAARIRPAGYFNQKAKKLKYLAAWVMEELGGDIDEMQKLSTPVLREKLLSLWGVGEETADSILLYAARRPVFVVDAYTHRVFFRHGFIKEGIGYHTVQQLFMDNLPQRVKLFNEYHALIVRVGKECCRKVAHCDPCPLRVFL